MNYDALRDALSDDDAMRAAGPIAREIVDKAEAEAKAMRDKLNTDCDAFKARMDARIEKQMEKWAEQTKRLYRRRYGGIANTLHTLRLAALWFLGRRPMR